MPSMYMDSLGRLLAEELGRNLGILRGPTIMPGGGRVQRDGLSPNDEVVIEEARVVDVFQATSAEGELAQVIIHTLWSPLETPAPTGVVPAAGLLVTKLPIKG